jgi:hypothetical protein
MRTLEIAGELGHLGRCIRHGFPVQNKYAFTASSSANSKLFTAGRDDNNGGEGAAEKDNSEIDALMTLAAFVAGGGTDGIDVDEEAADLLLPEIVPEETVEMWVAAYNLSHSPFFTYFFDGYTSSEEGIVGLDETDFANPAITSTQPWIDNAELSVNRRGIFVGHEALHGLINPSIVEGIKPTDDGRDLATDDILIGLDWVFSNCGGELGAHVSSIGAMYMKVFSDFKKGQTYDVYTHDMRLNEESTRLAHNLGTTIRDLSVGEAIGPLADRNLGSGEYFSRFFGQGFINQNEVLLLLEDVEQSSKASYHVGGRFRAFQSVAGNASTTVPHYYMADGTLRSVDVKLRLDASGHFGMRKHHTFRETTQFYPAETGPMLAPAQAEGDSHSWVLEQVHETILRDVNGVLPWAWFDNVLEVDAADLTSYMDPASTLRQATIEAVMQYFLNRFNSLQGSDEGSALPITWCRDDTNQNVAYSGGQTPLAYPGSIVVSEDSFPSFASGVSGSYRWRPGRTFVSHTHSRPDEYYSLQHGNELAMVFSFFDKTFRRVIESKNAKPYESTAPQPQFEAINIIAELSNRTGNPAIQAFLDDMIIFGGESVGAATLVNPFQLDRVLWDRNVHAPRAYRGMAHPEFNISVMSSDAASRFANSLAAYRMTLHLLGAIGRFDYSPTIPLTNWHFSTMYDEVVRFTGEVTDWLVTDTYNYVTMAVDPGYRASPATLLPGYMLMRQLLPDYGDTNAPLLPLAEAVPGNYVTAGAQGWIDPANYDQAALAQFFGFTPTDYNGEALPAFLFEQVDPTIIEVALAQVAATNVRLAWDGTDIAWVFTDMDVFDRESAMHAALVHQMSGAMVIGPSSQILAVGKSGDVIVDVGDTYTSANVATPSPTPTESPAQDESMDNEKE